MPSHFSLLYFIYNNINPCIKCSFNISIEYAHTAVQNETKLLWASATAHDIDQYRNNIDKLLENIVIDPDVLYCTDHQCTVRHDAILSYMII
jgi:hypothetical protein